MKLDDLMLSRYLNDSTVFSLLAVAITIATTIVLNSLLRSFIKIPKTLDTRRGRTYVIVSRNIISIVLFGIALHIIFLILNINIAPLLASAGIVGITVGIGARTLVEDLIAGFFLLSQDTIAVGDYINVGGQFEGTVDDMNFRSVKLRSLNGTTIFIPNGQVRQVINHSRGKQNIFIDIPVKADQDIDAINKTLKKILREMLNEKEAEYRLSDESEVFGIVNMQNGGAVIVRVILVTLQTQRYVVEKEFRYRVIKAFEKQKISLA